MTARLTSDFLVKALIRRTHDSGGAAMVLARGDATSGAILVLATDRGATLSFLERGRDLSGAALVQHVGPRDSDAAAADAYWRKRRNTDPDLWVVELDTPFAERFAAETIALD